MEKNSVGPVGGTMRKLDPVGKLFRGAWALYKAKFSTLAKIVLVPVAVMVAGGLLMATRGMTGVVVLGGLIYCAGFIIFVFAGIALIVSVASGTDFAASYRQSPKFFWPMVWVSILGGVVTFGGFVMLIVPGIMMALWFTFSRYLVIVENRRGLNALTQSREYVRGYWWAIFGRGILMAVALSVAAGISSAILAAIFGRVVGAVFNAWTWIFIVPFSIIYIYEIYRNLTVLKPELATTQAAASRDFLKVSGIVGLVGIIVIPIILIAIVGFVFTRATARYYSNNVEMSSSTASGTYNY
jgi:hypothetical protein